MNLRYITKLLHAFTSPPSVLRYSFNLTVELPQIASHSFDSRLL